MMINEFQGEYRFLSNFFPCKVEMDGVEFDSTEQAYQAAKTLDPEERKQFVGLNPADSKKLGRKITLRPDWEDVKIDVMLDLLRKKFKNPVLQEKLLSTGNQELIEGNFWNDFFWGMCKGNGLNILGQLLMQVRYEYNNAKAMKFFITCNKEKHALP